SKLAENRFRDCIQDFISREVTSEEITSSHYCFQKHLKMAQRISVRFQDYPIQQNEALAAKAGLLGKSH
ncbi:TIM9 translocase, partial [Trogon melanurus]|nr:TIM9 translocase [Trogon melanurus]NXJ82034.1 TIM9 translocase [Trogon melanurus]